MMGFSSKLNIIKQRTMQGLQQNLENLGLHSNALENTVLLRSNDPQLGELTRCIHELEDGLKGIRRAACSFVGAVKPMQEAERSVASAVQGCTEDGDALFADADAFAQLMDTSVLSQDLKATVIDPIDSHMVMLSDLKSRIKQRGLLCLEVRHLNETVDAMRNKKMAGTAKMSQAEDSLVATQVRLEQLQVSLYADLNKLAETRFKILHDVYLGFKTCQHRFLEDCAGSTRLLCKSVDLPVRQVEEVRPPPLMISEASVALSPTNVSSPSPISKENEDQALRAVGLSDATDIDLGEESPRPSVDQADEEPSDVNSGSLESGIEETKSEDVSRATDVEAVTVQEGVADAAHTQLKSDIAIPSGTEHSKENSVEQSTRVPEASKQMPIVADREDDDDGDIPLN